MTDETSIVEFISKKFFSYLEYIDTVLQDTSQYRGRGHRTSLCSQLRCNSFDNYT